jgi:hypothetical protein
VVLRDSTTWRLLSAAAAAAVHAMAQEKKKREREIEQHDHQLTHAVIGLMLRSGVCHFYSVQ